MRRGFLAGAGEVEMEVLAGGEVEEEVLVGEEERTGGLAAERKIMAPYWGLRRGGITYQIPGLF